MHRTARFALAIATYAVAISAYAIPITYTYTGVASGSLGSVSFSNAAFTIVLSGDTNGITPPAPNNVRTNPGTASVRITGFQPVTFSGMIASQFSLPPVALGIQLTGSGFTGSYLYFYSVQNSLTYNLSDAFGPYTAFTLGAAGGIYLDFPTSGGPLTLIPAGQVTFVAAPATVAEQIPLQWWPIELAMLAITLLVCKPPRRLRPGQPER